MKGANKEGIKSNEKSSEEICLFYHKKKEYCAGQKET